MPTDERISVSKSKSEQLTEFVLNLMQTHANNELLTYSKLLTSQLPPSYAALAYNDLQDVMFF